MLDDPIEEISLDGNAMGYAYGANMFGEEIVVVSEAPLTDLPTMYNGTVEKVGTADGGIPIYALTDHAQREGDSLSVCEVEGGGSLWWHDGTGGYVLVVDCAGGWCYDPSYYDPSALVRVDRTEHDPSSCDSEEPWVGMECSCYGPGYYYDRGIDAYAYDGSIWEVKDVTGEISHAIVKIVMAGSLLPDPDEPPIM